MHTLFFLVIHILNYFYNDLFNNNTFLSINQMCVVLNNRLSQITFLIKEKMCVVLKGLKCVVINDKCAVLNNAQKFKLNHL